MPDHDDIPQQPGSERLEHLSSGEPILIPKWDRDDTRSRSVDEVHQYFTDRVCAIMEQGEPVHLVAVPWGWLADAIRATDTARAFLRAGNWRDFAEAGEAVRKMREVLSELLDAVDAVAIDEAESYRDVDRVTAAKATAAKLVRPGELRQGEATGTTANVGRCSLCKIRGVVGFRCADEACPGITEGEATGTGEAICCCPSVACPVHGLPPGSASGGW